MSDKKYTSPEHAIRNIMELKSVGHNVPTDKAFFKPVGVISPPKGDEHVDGSEKIRASRNIAKERQSETMKEDSQEQKLTEFVDTTGIMRPYERLEKLKKQEKKLDSNRRTRPLPRPNKMEAPKELPKESPKIEKQKTTTDKLQDIASNVVTQFARRAIAPAYAAWKGLGVKPANPDESPNIVPTKQDKEKLGKPSSAQELETPEVKKARMDSVKVVTPPERPTGKLPAAKADAKGTSAFTGMPAKFMPPKPNLITLPKDTGVAKADIPVGNLPSAPTKPGTGIQLYPDDRGYAKTQTQEFLKTQQLAPAKSGADVGDKPSTSTAATTAGASGPAPAAGASTKYNPLSSITPPPAPAVVAKPGTTQANVPPGKTSGGKNDNKNRGRGRFWLPGATPGQSVGIHQDSNVQVDVYKHIPKEYMTFEETRYDIENVARPNSKDKVRVRSKQAEIIRKIVEEKKSSKKNTTVIINPELKQQEPEQTK